MTVLNPHSLQPARRGQNALFAPGQLVRHRRFAYRGLIFDVDPVFGHGDDWYEAVAHSNPPKDQPWYHILVDEEAHTTYVAESNLIACDETSAFKHPQIDIFFDTSLCRDGRYPTRYLLN